MARALAAVCRRMNDAQTLAVIRKRIEHGASAIGGAVVDDEDLAGDRQLDGEQPLDDLADGGLFVVDRNNDRQQLAHADGRARLRKTRLICTNLGLSN